jgi:hypothetical protein
MGAACCFHTVDQGPADIPNHTGLTWVMPIGEVVVAARLRRSRAAAAHGVPQRST